LAKKMIKRRKSKIIKIGRVKIGGEYPVAVQSMAKTSTADIEDTLKEIKKLEDAGCEIVRLAVKDAADAAELARIRKHTRAALVADIHFHWQLALKAIEAGVDKIRLNPGNIYKKAEVREIAEAARQAGIPIRVGVNSGSIRNLVSGVRCQVSGVDKMVKSALDYIRLLESFKFRNIVVSLKASDIFSTIAAYEKMAGLCEYPLHLGLTATGPAQGGIVKSSVTIGALLLEGIGDTIRVSLTAPPAEEVRVARAILEALGLRNFGPQIISCPTCGRCEVDLVKIVNELENKLATCHLSLAARPLKIAVMGCVVNGPGEAKEADLGIAFGKDSGMLFRGTKPAKRISVSACADTLLKEIRCLRPSKKK
jgi:(E)-4-hydroxy-3-methylbut-2-enyl-diphosphate synthase